MKRHEVFPPTADGIVSRTEAPGFKPSGLGNIVSKREVMRITNFLLDRIVAPLVVAFVSTLIIGTASKIETGNWVSWFTLVPNTWWIVAGLVMLLWLTAIAVRTRLKRLRELDAGLGLYSMSSSAFGSVRVGELNHADVIWMVSIPMMDFWDSSDALGIYPSNIEVETPPRCPKCKTELEEIHRFWGGYLWRCVSCGFQKKTRDSYFREADRAERKAKRAWETRHRGSPRQ